MAPCPPAVAPTCGWRESRVSSGNQLAEDEATAPDLATGNSK